MVSPRIPLHVRPDHRRWIAPTATFAVLLGLLAACGRAPEAEMTADASVAEEIAAESAAGGAPAPAPAAAPPAADAASPRTDPSQLVSAAASQSDPRRQFVRTADVRFRVDDVYRAALAIEDLVAAQGGFVVSNRIRSVDQDVRRRSIGDDRVLELAEVVTSGDLTVRVPAGRAQAFLRALARHATFLESRDVAARDAQFDLLRQQLAFRRGESLQQSLGDAVADGDRLDRKADAYAARAAALAARDEATVAQREFEDQVAFATVTLSLLQPPRLRSTELPDTEAVLQRHRTAFLPRLGQALADGWRVLLDLLVGLVALWPLWLVAGAGWLAWRALRAARRRTPPPA